MSLIERDDLKYVKGVARHWYKENSAINEPEAQERAMLWEAVLLAQSVEDISKALDDVALGSQETNQEGEANG